ncbi:hypothetical protein BKA69DRAFT_1064970, partial [Paraphysoderma sedebokerense]
MNESTPTSAFEEDLNDVNVVKDTKEVKEIVASGLLDNGKLKAEGNRQLFRDLRIRERTYDVNLVTTHMPTYEPLLDESLHDYFNSPVTRKHLEKLGIVC